MRTMNLLLCFFYTRHSWCSTKKVSEIYMRTSSKSWALGIKWRSIIQIKILTFSFMFNIMGEWNIYIYIYTHTHTFMDLNLIVIVFWKEEIISGHILVWRTENRIIIYSVLVVAVSSWYFRKTSCIIYALTSYFLSVFLDILPNTLLPYEL